MSAQYDRGSEVQTGILCDSASENDPFHTPSSSQKDPSAMLNTFPGDSSDGYSSAVSNSSSGAKSESSSIESFDKSSQHDAESEEEEEDRPTGSQVLAAYASPLRDGQRLRTSCDSIHDPGQWQVDSDGFINEQIRAGGPYLCSLPVTIFNLDGKSPLWTVFETISVHKMILSVLGQYKVNATSIKIKKCQYKY
ncbi:hypothetical protein DTO027I6_8632 [Penicillium roqueforti]|uniref:uncharacterized protein n=1 Tax=Penicillium roqueforti TaxID=5082 RepID=UPI00190E4B14|nr:uncharacterized protein LCP9604111_5251 [Penicillium roqueforti]KAF9248501.1 hypothetical protein LCP9604111_5251 [Penicillium roqueforti]KAI2699271.1 hypothetical protein CBS147372_6518 [Penicillium roqueforti]KAI3153546.1 hypothetical protein CBS147317_6354 [Penicillium roqueforti]KAI3190113.1 hypothetical protein DTO027I6_8632 [Penicillium roqueforti]KAI3227832.1 hypothetical protein CBS147310_7557 [Penicillium roqueforti]